MDRDLAEWARAFAWDARRTITQTYKERISQSMGFADQFRQGFSREQFTNYLNTIEAQASFHELPRSDHGFHHTQVDLLRIHKQCDYLLFYRSHVSTRSIPIYPTVSSSPGHSFGSDCVETSVLCTRHHPGG